MRRAMPKFWRVMRWALRTAEEGADTVVWLSAANVETLDEASGFWLDRKRVPVHLRKATHHDNATEIEFITLMDELINR